MRKTFVCLTAAVVFSVVALPVQSDETLSGDQLKELITGKTLHVTNPKKGDSWHMYHAADGKSSDNRGRSGTWKISEKGEHCNDLAKNPKFKCAKVYRKSDGTYERVSADGSIKVIWTKIVNGKDF